jgi:quercetin dioxygenase-like cupin family protein
VTVDGLFIGTELPGDRHGVSSNASEAQPAKLLAVFVVDTNETDW